MEDSQGGSHLHSRRVCVCVGPRSSCWSSGTLCDSCPLPELWSCTTAEHTPLARRILYWGEWVFGVTTYTIYNIALPQYNMQYQCLTVEINFNLYMHHYFVDISLILSPVYNSYTTSGVVYCLPYSIEIGRPHDRTTVTRHDLVCRLQFEKTHKP